MNIRVEIRNIYKNTTSPVKATANIVIDDCFVVHNVKLVDNGNGPFISMPAFRGREGKWISISHPINSECRQEIQDAVLEAYEAE